MMASATTKDFGVLACDSARFDTEKAEMNFDSNRLFIIDGKKVFTFIGTHLYLANISREKLSLPFDSLCLYLKDYLKNERKKVQDQMESAIKDSDENKPHFCLFIMGLHGGYPTLAQFNSFNDFSPKYLWSDNGLKFATVLYGDDSKPDKSALFKETTKFMEDKARELKADSPGLVGEILTRGIYHKADQEQKIGLKKKWAGGVTNVACLNKHGVYSLSGFTLI